MIFQVPTSKYFSTVSILESRILPCVDAVSILVAKKSISTRAPKATSTPHALLQIVHLNHVRRIDLSPPPTTVSTINTASTARDPHLKHDARLLPFTCPAMTNQQVKKMTNKSGQTHPLKHQLRHPLPLLYLKFRLPMIKQQHLHLATVIRIDDPRPSIDEVFGSQP
jgi:hypothetical protein